MAQTILVIDDDPALVNLLREDLETEGYSVLQGYDGQTAIQIALKSLPHLIVMDVNMPGMSGSEALTLLRKSPMTQFIPVVLLTGDSASGSDPVADRAGRVTRLQKPVDLDRFNTIVKNVLSHPVS